MTRPVRTAEDMMTSALGCAFCAAGLAVIVVAAIAYGLWRWLA